MIGIVDTGVGNTLSVRRAIAAVTSEPLCHWGLADKLVFAGQGSFASIDESTKMLLKHRINDGVPYLGICLGMQILYDESEEAPDVPGLGVLPGVVRKLPRMRMGYEDGHYFCHQYSCGVDDVTQKNVTGVQWHPEKSGKRGLEWLDTWFKGMRC